MDDFGRLSLVERAPFLTQAADKLNMSAQIVEKDFWVCWTLGRLFSLPVGSTLIFKGGTSLSKVYRVIERFSEDVDLSIDRVSFGFTGEKDPEKAVSVNKQTKLLDELSAACREYVQKTLLRNLQEDFARVLNSNDSWSLEIDQVDPSGQTLLFHYPSSQKGRSYISDFVKIEMGARSDHWPTELKDVRPYLSEALSGAIKKPDAQVKVLSAARTFWEKATILHMYSHLPDAKKAAPRQSRHFYDFYKLLLSKHKGEAVGDLQLLKRVAEHKRIYFRAGWAKYDEAAPGTLKLVPAKRVLADMERDYAQMKEMFFGPQPDWQLIISSIQEFEQELNFKK